MFLMGHSTKGIPAASAADCRARIPSTLLSGVDTFWSTTRSPWARTLGEGFESLPRSFSITSGSTRVAVG